MSDVAVYGSLVYSHILPPIMAFIAVILICSGIMDRKTNYAIAGVVLFFAAGVLPFLILPFIIGS